MDVNVFTKFRGNPCNIYKNISLKTTNVNLMVAQDEKPEDHQSH